LVLRLTDRWYVFAELVWEVADHQGNELSFRTADVLVPTPDNEFVSQLGIGTKPLPGGAS
jgi:hypothetical protein